jgi:hypothetical protein
MPLVCRRPRQILPKGKNLPWIGRKGVNQTQPGGMT